MLRVISYQKDNSKTVTKEYEGLNPHLDHHNLLQRYFESHRVRNYSVKSMAREKTFLESWFELHSNQNRKLFTWEAMQPILGRKRILNYANALIDSGLSSSTVRSYLGSLSRYFAYTLEYPYFIEGEITQRIQDRYHSIEQPVSEYDYPKHVYNGEKLGVPFDPERLYDFYSIIREKYLLRSRYKPVSARNYAMLVLTGESGLRIDEVCHLELIDLHFESNKLQTRFAKGTKGSGKRSRLTFFTPLAQDTIKYYLKVRSQLIDGHDDCKLLFPSKSGQVIDYSSAHAALKSMIHVAQKENFPILPHMSWHWLRRLFATRFIERFPNRLSELVTLLGHVTPNTVHCYIRHSEAWMDNRIKEMLERGFECP